MARAEESQGPTSRRRIRRAAAANAAAQRGTPILEQSFAKQNEIVGIPPNFMPD
ncbi:hypothetical protein [Actinospica sp.]|uniref:hypothetical protein n=1 Tax=Actinospica sp. TaxID=1872142 RepID=UPI002BAD32D6|nr:hypothetical protein [Actinospica sp.]HWG26678.1 hypothetical protein [Actinospica sp.]